MPWHSGIGDRLRGGWSTIKGKARYRSKSFFGKMKNGAKKPVQAAQKVKAKITQNKADEPITFRGTSGS